MRKFAIAALAAALLGGVAHADTIKVGVVGPFSGPFALQGKNFKAGIDAYISQYYPELSKAMDLGEWGPVGTADDIADWLRTFADAGVDYFICRFGSLDQFGQVERFARDVLPRVSGVAGERVRG